MISVMRAFRCALAVFAVLAGRASPSASQTSVCDQPSADMTNRFNQVDTKLILILTTLNSNFALIDYNLGVIIVTEPRFCLRTISTIPSAAGCRPARFREVL